jgi:hypothetical protein
MSNYVTQLNRKLVPQNTTGATDDTDLAFRIWYDGDESTATVDLNTAVANTLRLTYGATTSDFLLSNSAYDTGGELQDAVRALPGWHMLRAGMTRADATYSSDLKLLTIASTNALSSAVPGGVTVYWDTSNWDARSKGIGSNFLTTSNGQTVPAQACSSMSTVPWDQDPIYNNYPPDDGTPKYSPGYGANLQGVTFKGAYGGSEIATVTITPCTDSADGTALVYPVSTATTGVTLNLGSSVLGAEGIDTLGGWLVVKVTANGQAITSSTLTCNGYITFSGGQTD